MIIEVDRSEKELNFNVIKSFEISWEQYLFKEGILYAVMLWLDIKSIVKVSDYRLVSKSKSYDLYNIILNIMALNMCDEIINLDCIDIDLKDINLVVHKHNDNIAVVISTNKEFVQKIIKLL